MNPAPKHPSLARYALGRGRTPQRGRLGPPEQAQGPRAQRRIPPHPSSQPHVVGVPPASQGPSPLLLGVCRDQGPLLPSLPPVRAPYPEGGAQARACLTPALESTCGPFPPSDSILSRGSQRPRGTRTAQGPRHTVFPLPGKLPAPSGALPAPFSLSVSPSFRSYPQPGNQRTLWSSSLLSFHKKTLL